MSTRHEGRAARRTLLALGIAVGVGCGDAKAKQATPPYDERQRQELLTVYTMLEKTLSDEAKLGKLAILKKVTLDGPNQSIGTMMDTLSDSADARGEELAELRKKSPAVAGKPAHNSPVATAITEIAKDFGQTEMLSREGGFDIRFVLVQAQATRMVSAMAMALAKHDPNPARTAWLHKLSNEYEGYRAQLVSYAGGVPVKPD